MSLIAKSDRNGIDYHSSTPILVSKKNDYCRGYFEVALFPKCDDREEYLGNQ